MAGRIGNCTAEINVHDKTRPCEKCRHLERDTHVLDDCRIPQESGWFGIVQRQNKDEAERMILQMTVDEKRNRGRPKRRWGGLGKEDMARNHDGYIGTLQSVEAERKTSQKIITTLQFEVTRNIIPTCAPQGYCKAQSLPSSHTLITLSCKQLNARIAVNSLLMQQTVQEIEVFILQSSRAPTLDTTHLQADKEMRGHHTFLVKHYSQGLTTNTQQTS